MSEAPLVTIGCVTNRPWCHDWLFWNIEKQSYRPLEVIIVAQSKPEISVEPPQSSSELLVDAVYGRSEEHTSELQSPI